ncbi:hypothetical protein Poli38472_000270 [Pythium oligandrum]|uniref:Uncharacterized protein n=1 Tax=Pythium oligandrum TaxID=41045 RepID=A0A8K1CC08_PYTOL|nr:hypothetical protein Poli38472_000270 [Pythium oligandrum]|eukprot:TMW60228.1 hypothetical protein Poli38472_000270 [Pythium oligandrum]
MSSGPPPNSSEWESLMTSIEELEPTRDEPMRDIPQGDPSLAHEVGRPSMIMLPPVASLGVPHTGLTPLQEPAIASIEEQAILDLEATELPQNDDVDASSPTASFNEELQSNIHLPPLLGSTNKAVSFAPNRGRQRPSMINKQSSLSVLPTPDPRHTTTSEVDPVLAPITTPRSQTAPRRVSKTISPSRRRLTISSNEISHHALERLGVNTDILKKEKGMKKLGISDVDIERSEELKRYSGVPFSLKPATKAELIFGFTQEQLMRVKAINRLGTSEQEILDEYSRRISMLGTHERPIVQSIK